MDDRALATIRTIDAIEPIIDADAIEAAKVGGWTVVVKKGEFAPGDEAVYFEIDSFLPTDWPQFAFLAPRGERTQNGVKGHVLRTAKLRGVFSQGLLLRLGDLADRLTAFTTPSIDPAADTPVPPLLRPGLDLTEALGITKWDPPLPTELQGAAIGYFPTNVVRKTDAERVQNLTAGWEDLHLGVWEATEKVDGVSMTVIRDADGTLRVCGRNVEYRRPEEGETVSALWRVALDEIEPHLIPGAVVQCEVVGPGVQSNRLQLAKQRAVVFGYFQDGQAIPRYAWPDPFRRLAAPIYDFVLPLTIDRAVEQVDGIPSLLNPRVKAEGVVWHEVNRREFDVLDGRSCFKVISNRYLLKNQD